MFQLGHDQLLVLELADDIQVRPEYHVNAHVVNNHVYLKHEHLDFRYVQEHRQLTPNVHDEYVRQLRVHLYY